MSTSRIIDACGNCPSCRPFLQDPGRSNRFPRNHQPCPDSTFSGRSVFCRITTPMKTCATILASSLSTVGTVRPCKYFNTTPYDAGKAGFVRISARTIRSCNICSTFDDYFFHGSLRGFVTVRWIDYNPNLIVGQKIEALDGGIRVALIMVRFPGDLDWAWTRPRVLTLLSSLLREMMDAMLMTFGCRGRDYACFENSVNEARAWIELCQATEDELNRSF